MNAPVDILATSADSRLGIIDCDIHPYPKAGALNAYLPERWRNHLATYGKFNCGPYADRGTYPRFSPNTCRRDCVAPSGGPPGSDVGFHSRPVTRSLQHRVWRPGTAARRQHLAQSGRSRGAVRCDERLAGA